MNGSINDRFKLVRELRDMTMKQVAEQIGVRDSSIAMIETGKNNPSARTIKLFCYIMKINENWLRTGEGEMELETDLLSQMQHKYNLSPEASAIIAEFIDLPANAQEIVAQYVLAAADRIRKLHAEDEEKAERHAQESSPERSEEREETAE